jgi:hypothetical protein
MEVSGQLHAPVALPPRKEPLVPIEYEVGWSPEPVWTIWRRENSLRYRDSTSDPSVIKPIASPYTDYAILAPCVCVCVCIDIYMRYHLNTDYLHAGPQNENAGLR